MMRAVLDPMDTLALVTFLRSSMVNMPDSALLPLWRAGFPGAWAQLSEPTLEHCIDAIRTAETDCRRLHPHVEGLEAVASWADHLEAVVRRVAVLRDEIQTTPFDLWLDRVRELLLPDVVNSLAYQGVYRLANIERFFRLLAEKVSDSAGGFHGVLRHLRDAVAHQREAEESRPTDAGDAVQLMTVHKSKGLAFTHTYVVDLHHRFKAFSIRGGTYASVKHGIQLLGMWTPNFDLEWSHRREVERAERVRLLYVAMTRARDRLVLMGSWPRILSGQRGAKQGLDLFGDRVPPLPGPTEVWPTIPDGMDSAQKDHIHWRFPGRYPAEVNVAEQAEAGLAVQAARPTSEAQRLWSINRANRPWTQGPSSVAEESESGPPKSVLGRAEALKIGTVIHGLLEQIAKGEVEVNPESFAAVADSLIGDGPVSPAGQERIAVLLETLREGSLLRYLSSIDIIGTEVPFIMQETGQGPVGAWVGSIDLMYRCPDTGDIVIVDHKTDRVGDRSIDDVAAHHAGQGSLYAQAVMQALGLSTPPRFEVWLIEADARVEVG
jgi:ATP-dependent exoDNAse (exonuclease V) beta subunit